MAASEPHRAKKGKPVLFQPLARGVWPQSNLSSGGEFDFEIIRVVKAVPALVPSIAFEGETQV
ncbi:MAG: hypothetical protein ABSC18_07210, partial [Verrucomicrobiota bacterium]